MVLRAGWIPGPGSQADAVAEPFIGHPPNRASVGLPQKLRKLPVFLQRPAGRRRDILTFTQGETHEECHPQPHSPFRSRPHPRRPDIDRVAGSASRRELVDDQRAGGGKHWGAGDRPFEPGHALRRGGGAGIFKSTNFGGSWTAVNTGLTDLLVGPLAVDPSAPNTLYAGTYYAGVFKSTNGGMSWTAVNTGLSNMGVRALAIDPSTPATLYAAGTGDSGVFKSINRGGSWTAVNSGLDNKHVWALAIAPSAPATLYAGTYGSGVFKSTNGGVSWTHPAPQPEYTAILALAIHPTAPDTLWASSTWEWGPYGVFKSTDGGVSWTDNNTGLNNLEVAAPGHGSFGAGHALCRNLRRRCFQEHEWRRELDDHRHRPDQPLRVLRSRSIVRRRLRSTPARGGGVLQEHQRREWLEQPPTPA